LCSLVHRAQGRPEQALIDYQAYATDWSTSAQRMNLHVRDVLTTLAAMPGGRPADLASQPPGYFRRALQFIDSAASQPLSLAGIANAVGVSERTLRQCFQVYTGKSPKQFSLDRRLDQVHAMLTSGQAAGMTLADLARRMGFSNATRFSRLYKARFGQPPQAMRSP
jgi:transcriptional regulator GlxA family with amidase domain